MWQKIQEISLPQLRLLIEKQYWKSFDKHQEEPRPLAVGDPFLKKQAASLLDSLRYLGAKINLEDCLFGIRRSPDQNFPLQFERCIQLDVFEYGVHLQEHHSPMRRRWRINHLIESNQNMNFYDYLDLMGG